MNTATAVDMDVENRTLRIERIFKATPQQVFDAFIKPEQLAAWWGLEGMNVTRLELNTVESGSWYTVFDNPEGEEYHVSGKYLLIDPPHRLILSWAWVEGGVRGHETQVELTFSAIEAGCKLGLVQTLFENEEGRSNHNDGWHSSLNCLEAFLAETTK